MGHVLDGHDRASAPGVRVAAVLALVVVTAVWGSTFFMLKGVVTRVPAADFLAVRFWLAALVLWTLRPAAPARLGTAGLRAGLGLGVLFGTAQLVQTWGLARTSASVSGFVTGMYVVVTPLLAGLLLRQRVPGAVRAAVVLATAGLGVLSLRGLALGTGEALTLGGAVLYALHIVGLGGWARGRDAYGLAVVQTAAVAVVCSVAAVPGGVVLPSRADDWWVLLYMAVASGAATLFLQTWAQAHLPATRAAIVMTLEPVWAGGFAVAFGGESVGARLLIGGSLTLSAMLLAELGPRRSSRRDHAVSG